MSVSIWQILLVAVLFMLLFGRGKVPQLMSDIAQGIKSFKAGIREDDAESSTPPQPKVTAQPSQTESNNLAHNHVAEKNGH